MEEGFQHKRKQVVSVESDESVPGKGLMVDTKHAGREEELFRINLGAEPTGRLTDVISCCRQLSLRLRLPVKWLNKCLNKAD